MAIKFKKFTSRGGNDIRAIKLTERNVHSVVPWLAKKLAPFFDTMGFVVAHKEGDSIKVRVRIPKKGWRVARPGDYVGYDVQDPAVPFIVKAKDFEEKYQEVK